jgi:hypothetical protein
MPSKREIFPCRQISRLKKVDEATVEIISRVAVKDPKNRQARRELKKLVKSQLVALTKTVP